MQFRKLEREDLPRLLPYFQAQQGKIGNYSAGLLFMWGRYLSTQYCEEDGCLFLIDHYFGNSYFYYPLSKDGDEAAEERGIEKIEAYCRIYPTSAAGAITCTTRRASAHIRAASTAVSATMSTNSKRRTPISSSAPTSRRTCPRWRRS